MMMMMLYTRTIGVVRIACEYECECSISTTTTTTTLLLSNALYNILSAHVFFSDTIFFLLLQLEILLFVVTNSYAKREFIKNV